MTLRTALTGLLEIEHPVLLAPMAGGSGGALAAAVSAAGGFGLIGIGYDDADWIEAEFENAGNQRVGAGFITWRLAQQPHLLDVTLAREPSAVMLSFGDPAPFATKIKDSGAKLICQIQTVSQAKQAAGAGADVIVAQGGEAGGHGASRGTLALTPAVVDAVAPVPVVAAGGIADGRGLAAVLMLGAAGVLMGTRFYAAEESLAHPEAKARMVSSGGDETLRTSVIDMARGLEWPRPYTISVISNGFTQRWHGNEAALADNLEIEQARYETAAKAGDFDIRAVIAGEGIDLIHDIAPARNILERTVAEAETHLRAAREAIV